MDYVGLIALHTTEAIGADPERVRRIIDVSNEQGYVFHGRRIFAPTYENVSPLTPEGGQVSFWVSGAGIFGCIQDRKFQTRDSPFFNYCHSQDTSNMSVARIGDLRAAGISPYSSELNGYTVFRDEIPSYLIHWIVVADEKLCEKTRERGIKMEQAMLDSIYNVVNGDFRPGSVDLIKL